ncbi:hypothetical protein Daus18300_008311 [Diaporthe australafricana]|uniref:Uncharacterized protein n=1 Tax=Diaporthe australafricana TaxID=127596 RepID=A0ABR3WJG0_9PEZI
MEGKPRKPRRSGVKWRKARAREAEAEARASAEAKLRAIQDARLAAPDQDETAYSTVGIVGVRQLDRPGHKVVPALPPSYLDDDLSTVASDITFKAPGSTDRSPGDVDEEDDGNDESTDGEGHDDYMDEPEFMVNGTVIDDTDKYMRFEGVTNVPHIFGEAREYLFNSRFVLSGNDTDYSVWVKKNLILAFQGHVLYEDCLSRGVASRTQSLSQLQSDIGPAVQRGKYYVFLPAILRIYKQARVDVIARALQRGELPQDPQDSLTAVLIQLIDRAIMFSTTKAPLRKTPSTNTVQERIEQRSRTLRDGIEDSSKTWELFLEVGSLIPWGERAPVGPRPWSFKPWVAANVADVIEPATDVQTATQPWTMVLPTRNAGGNVEPVETSQGPMPQPSQALPQKRKRDEDIKAQPRLESKDMVTNTEMGYCVHEDFEAAGTSKRLRMSNDES